MSTKALMTVERFGEMAIEDAGDYELVEGELIPLSSGTPRHSEIRDLIGDLLRSYCRRNPIGKALAEIDCRVGEDSVRRPDVSLFLDAKVKQIDFDRIPVQFAPDIAVEVLSQSEKAVDVNRKVRDYLGAGSQEVWIIDAANGELFVHSLAGIRMLREADILETALLPGLTIAVKELLA